MTSARKQEITHGLVDYIKEHAVQNKKPGRVFALVYTCSILHLVRSFVLTRRAFFSLRISHSNEQVSMHCIPFIALWGQINLSLLTACKEDIQNDADYLQINLGPFSKDATYSDLKALNITGVQYMIFLFRCFS